MLEISHFIITNVEKTSLSLDYFYIGLFFSFILACKYNHTINPCFISLFEHLFFRLVFPMYYQNSEKLTQYINGFSSSSNSDLTKSALVNETLIERSENVSNDFLGEQIVELFYILPSSLNLESFSVSLNDGLKYWNSIRLEYFNFFNILFLFAALYSIECFILRFFVVMNMFFSTLVLCIMFFTLLSIAERTLVQVGFNLL